MRTAHALRRGALTTNKGRPPAPQPPHPPPHHNHNHTTAHPHHATPHPQPQPHHTTRSFLELDPSLPATGLQHSNSRESRLGKPVRGGVASAPACAHALYLAAATSLGLGCRVGLCLAPLAACTHIRSTRCGWAASGAGSSSAGHPRCPSSCALQSEGWPMTRRQYEKLVQLVRPDAER